MSDIQIERRIQRAWNDYSCEVANDDGHVDPLGAMCAGYAAAQDEVDQQRSIVSRQREVIHTMIKAWPGGTRSLSFAGVVGLLKQVIPPIDFDKLTDGPLPSGKCGYEQFEPDGSGGITKSDALEGINAIRNSIIGLQNINWSEHIYPLVSLLERAGYRGLDYPEARANVGRLIEFRDKALEAMRSLADHNSTLRGNDRAMVEAFLELYDV